MGNTSTTIENVYEETTQSTRVGVSTSPETLTEETTRREAYDSEAGQSPCIGILDEIEDAEIARRGHTLTGEAGANGGATPIMDTINTSTPIEDRIRILSDEMIIRGLETEESFKRLRSYENKRNTYRCLMEELARYYDRQTALGLPIERPVLKTGIYMQHIMLI